MPRIDGLAAPICVACGDIGVSTSGAACVPCVASGRVVDWATCFHNWVDAGSYQTCSVCDAARVKIGVDRYRVDAPGRAKHKRLEAQR